MTYYLVTCAILGPLNGRCVKEFGGEHLIFTRVQHIQLRTRRRVMKTLGRNLLARVLWKEAMGARALLECARLPCIYDPFFLLFLDWNCLRTEQQFSEVEWLIISPPRGVARSGKHYSNEHGAQKECGKINQAIVKQLL